MSDALLPALKLVRQACAGIAVSLEGDRAMTLQRVDVVLARLVMEEQALPGIQSKTGEQFMAATSVKKDVDFVTQLHELARKIRDLPVDKNALHEPWLLKILRADEQYWQDYLKSIHTTLKQPTEIDTAEEDDSKSGHLDSGILLDYLKSAFPEEDALEISEFNVASLGFSKKTVIVELRNNKQLPSGLVFRIDRPYNFLGTKVVDEYPILKDLHDRGLRVPRPIIVEESGAVLGQPFVVFERVGGAPLGSNFIMPARNDAIVAEMARHLATLHAVPVEDAAITLKKSSVRQNLQEEIESYYDDWQALDIDSPVMEAAFKWIRANQARGLGPPVVVHNDYNFNNILVENNQVSAIVDWELVRVGTAAADLGYFYYSAENVASFDLYLEEYEKAGGHLPDAGTLDFYILWGQVRLTVMVFQSEAGFLNDEFSDIRYGITGALFLPVSIQRVASKLVELLAQ